MGAATDGDSKSAAAPCAERVVWYSQLLLSAVAVVTCAVWSSLPGGPPEGVHAIVAAAVAWALFVLVAPRLRVGDAVKRVGIRLAFVLLSLFAALCIGELGLRWRIMGELRPALGISSGLITQHATRGWNLAPNQVSLVGTEDYEVSLQTNGLGQRDGPHEAHKAQGAYRIVLLGDSFMQANQVALEETFQHQLELELEVEVLNMGVSGYGTAQQLIALREDGLDYDPDMVILALYLGNDVSDNHLELQRGVRRGPRFESEFRPYAVLEQGKGITLVAPKTTPRAGSVRPIRPGAVGQRLITSRLLQSRAPGATVDPNVFWGVFIDRFSGTNPADHKPEWYREVWAVALEVTRRLVLEIAAAARLHGADFVVFLVPSKFEIDDAEYESVVARFPSLSVDRLGAVDRIRDSIRAGGVPLVDLREQFSAHVKDGRAPLYFPRDRHWTAAAHQLAAKQVGTFLRPRLKR